MSRAVFVASALWLITAACAPLPTMLDYCAKSGACQCADGACCSLGEQACDLDVPCCAGMECSGEGVCVLGGAVPTVTLSPSAVDFGWVSADAAPPVQEVVLRNEGTIATRPLALALESRFEGSFLLDPRACDGAELAPGTTCTAAITFVAAGSSVRVRTASLRVLEAPEGLPSRELGVVWLSGEAGHELTVSVNGMFPISVGGGELEPVRIPPGQRHVIWRPRPWTAIFDAPGHYPVTFSPGTWTTFPVEEEVPARLETVVEAERNVRLTVEAGPKALAGDVNVAVTVRWMVEGVQWQWPCTPGRLCDTPAYGLVSLTFTRGSYAGPFTWTGACAGTQAELCVLEGVNGRTDVGITTE